MPDPVEGAVRAGASLGAAIDGRGEVEAAASPQAAERPRRRGRLRRAGSGVRAFWRVAMDANITGQSAMVAYALLLGIIPVALLALFAAGQVLSSQAIQKSVLLDLAEVFPGATHTTLNSLLSEVRNSTTTTGIGALIASIYLGTSFWGALDTAFNRIYHCQPRTWLQQKRFGLAMLGVVLVFMVATVGVPVAQSILKAGVDVLPFDLARVNAVIYAISLSIGLMLLFGCLSVIYVRVPNMEIRWRCVWPGALGVTIAIGVVDYAFPAYLTNISTIAQFGTGIVFVLIVLGWFYLVALLILAGAILNAMRLGQAEAEDGAELAEAADVAAATERTHRT